MGRALLALLLMLSPSTVWSQVSVSKMQCALGTSEATLFIECSDTIASFQKPERSGKDLIIRIADATMASDAVMIGCDDLNVRTERIRQFLVIRIRADKFTGDASVRRSGPLALTVTMEHSTSDQPSQSPSTSPTPTPSPTSDRWALDVIVIDAGHGGRDVGAEGVNGVNEKDVTLALARKLRDLVKQTFPKTKVVMTRDGDNFVELFRRTQIANESKGKLFVSIHCNSMPTKPHPANGCETYILRPGRNEDAARVAAQENASVKFESAQDRYASMTEDQLIVATMAQRSFVRFSEDLAGKIQKRVAAATGLTNRGVNQAGFFVLVGASMPNILFETAFLSNHKDAAYISSTAGQNATAKAMLDAITDYATSYERALKN